MSDFPTPPPPPPDLTAPPAGGFTGTNWGRAPFRRVRGLATAILVLLGVSVIGAAIDLALLPRRVDVAREFLRTGDEDTFNDEYVGTTLGSALFVLASLGLVVVSIIWLYRVVGNHRLLGRRTSWSPGFAIGGWFLPPALYVIPLLILRESWKASAPTVPPGDERWRETPESPLPYLWFVLYSLFPIGLGIAGASLVFRSFGGDADDIAESIADTQGIAVAQSIVSILGAIAWALIVRGLTARHTQLTGEVNGR